MFDLKILQKQPDLVAQALEKRGSAIKVDEFLDLDQRRRKALAQVEALKNTRNQQSARVAQLKKAGQNAEELVAELGSLSGQIRNLDQEAEALQEEVNAWLLGVPNMPDASVPVGRSEADNVEVARWGRPRQFDFPVLDHMELGLRTGGLDLERAGKLTGSRFSVSRGMIARLERALANYYLDVQTEEFGHLEILPPFMVNRQTMQGTGQLPKFEEDLFKLAAWDYYLIPTAEVPLTNLHAGETLDEDILPLLYTAATPCFRSEAGSYGKDTRGLIRQHQFTKVEMVHFAHPDKSFAQLETMRSFAETLLQRLELPYRTIVLCTGDMGFASAKTYDVEVWLPAQNTYREISSCSNCTDFQARRANIRFKPKGAAKSELVHTLNGSGLPTGRSLVAVMENYQTTDGGVEVPKVLQPYMNGLTKIEPVNL